MKRRAGVQMQDLQSKAELQEKYNKLAAVTHAMVTAIRTTGAIEDSARTIINELRVDKNPYDLAIKYNQLLRLSKNILQSFGSDTNEVYISEFYALGVEVTSLEEYAAPTDASVHRRWSEVYTAHNEGQDRDVAGKVTKSVDEEE